MPTTSSANTSAGHTTSLARATNTPIHDEFADSPAISREAFGPLAREIQAVKDLRNARNELPPFAFTGYERELAQATPISALGLSQQTLDRCQQQYVLHFVAGGRIVSVSEGIDSYKTLAGIPRFQLREHGFTDSEVAEIEKKVNAFGLEMTENFPDNLASHVEITTLTEVRGGFWTYERGMNHDHPETKALVAEDIAFIPGVSAESVAWLKQILVKEESGRVRHLSSIGDLIQIVPLFPDDWTGFSIPAVTNYLLQFDLNLNFDVDSDDADGVLNLTKISAVSYSEGISVDMAKLMQEKLS